MTDTRDDLRDDGDVRTAVRAAGDAPTDTFRTDLRARLLAVAAGDVELHPIAPRRAHRTWVGVAAAAAVLAVVVGAIAVVRRDDAASADELAGHVWVAIDHDAAYALPVLAFTPVPGRPGRYELAGTDGCNHLEGEFALVGGAVADARTGMTLMLCGNVDARPVTPVDAAVMAIADQDVLTIRADGASTTYVALDSLRGATLGDLTGEWTMDGIDIGIRPANPDGVSVIKSVGDDQARAVPIVDALSSEGLAAWLVGDRAIVRVSDEVWPGSYVRLERAPAPVLALRLVARTWVAVDGEWTGTSPTLLFFDGPDAEPGVLRVGTDVGCNGGGLTFRLDGDRVVDATGSTGSCGSTVATVADGTVLEVIDRERLTVTSGDTSSVFVALDSLEQAARTDLDGAWSGHGSTVTIDGDTVGSPDPTLLEIASSAVANEPIEAWRYGDGVILRGRGGFLQLHRVMDTPDAGTVAVDPVVTTGRLDEAEEALVSGPVALVGGCLVVGASMPVVWQPGTTWDPARSEVVLPDGSRVAMGVTIEAGGGAHAASETSAFGVDDAGVERVAACAEQLGGELFVIQSQVDVVG